MEALREAEPEIWTSHSLEVFLAGIAMTQALALRAPRRTGLASLAFIQVRPISTNLVFVLLQLFLLFIHMVHETILSNDSCIVIVPEFVPCVPIPLL